MALSDIEEKIGYVFKDKSLLKTAMTHTSYANERHKDGHLYSNERLEFVGDSIVGLIVARHLFETHPDWTEGQMSRVRSSVVCEESLAKLSEKIEIPQNLKLGVGEYHQNGKAKPSIKSDAMESLVAAVFFDSDFDTVNKIFLPMFVKLLDEVSLAVIKKDYKTKLQEILGESKIKPEYTFVSMEGPAHAPIFTMQVEAKGYSALGTGKTKREAEQNAANEIIKILEEKKV